MKHFNQLFHKNIIQKITIYGSVITLTGTDGTADITINDIPNKVSATFLTDLTTTARNWVAANIEHYEYHGYSVSASSGVITVTPKSDWDTVNRINAAIINLTEDLSGTLTGVFEPDFSKANIWDVTFTMDSTISNPKNPKDGDKMILRLVGTGSYALSWGDSWGSDNSLTYIDTDVVTIKVQQSSGVSFAKATFSWSTYWLTRNGDGITVIRTGIRNGSFVTDKTLTAIGFDGTENNDWVNVSYDNKKEGVLKNIIKGNTFRWLRFSDAINRTVDAGLRVSSFRDKLGSENDLVQTDINLQPILTDTGILSDGTKIIKSAQHIGLSRCSIYIVVKPIQWASLDTIADAFTVDKMWVFQYGTSPKIRAYGTVSSGETIGWTLNTIGILRILFNGASSKIQANESGWVAFNHGVTAINGLTLFAKPDGTSIINAEIQEVICRFSLDSDTETDAIYSCLKNKYII